MIRFHDFSRASTAALGAVIALLGCSGPSAGKREGQTNGGAEPAGSGGSATQATGGTSAAGAPGVGGTSTASAGTTGTSGTGGDATTPLEPVDASCDLPDAAFCDPFNTASPGGRAGDLDDSKWSFGRVGFGCASSFALPATPLNVCGVWQTVDPGGPDSAFCVDENQDHHWVEGFDDNTSFNFVSARVRQPFDFKDRTGTIQWEADARTSGSHGWWVETWITEDPVPAPNSHNGVQLVTSKNAIGIKLDLNCGAESPEGTGGSGFVGVSQILVVDNYQLQEAYDPLNPVEHRSRCVKTEQGSLNKLQFKISENRIEVFGTDAGGTELIPLAEADVNLGWSRGYLHLSHVHYNAHKINVSMFQAYQWARVAFDGPQLPAPRAYEIPDPLTPTPAENAGCPEQEVYRVSYSVTDGVTREFGADTATSLTFKDVDPTGAIGGRLDFNTTFVAAGDTLKYRFNGGTWHDYVVPAINTSWEFQGFSIPVDAADLVPGDNTLEVGTTSVPFNMPANSMHIANIDLELEVP